jgi:hypothetical protein
MKKMALVLVLAALSLMASPAMAAPDSPRVAPVLSAADQAFLASLVTAPAPVPAAKRPAVRGKALCTASANCESGGTISCSGNNSTTSCSAADQDCSVGQTGYVKCDGVTTSCPACSCDVLLAACWDSCVCGPLSFQCSPYLCRCNRNCP